MSSLNRDRCDSSTGRHSNRVLDRAEVRNGPVAEVYVTDVHARVDRRKEHSLRRRWTQVADLTVRRHGISLVLRERGRISLRFESADADSRLVADFILPLLKEPDAFSNVSDLR